MLVYLYMDLYGIKTENEREKVKQSDGEVVCVLDQLTSVCVCMSLRLK